jgi:hypothetical protein
MYTPKKLKWNSLTEFRDYLVANTTEKIVLFNGYKLVTQTTEYGLLDGLLRIYPKQKKVEEPKLELGNRPKVPKKKIVGYEKGTTFLNRKPIYEKEPKPKSKKDILAEMRERGKKALDKKKKGKR